MPRTCTTCVWMKIDSKTVRYACRYDGEWKMWLDKSKVQKVALCMEKCKDANLFECRWSDKIPELEIVFNGKPTRTVL